MYELPKECPETLEHALLHLNDTLDHEKKYGKGADPEMLFHNTSIAYQIISNIVERG